MQIRMNRLNIDPERLRDRDAAVRRRQMRPFLMIIKLFQERIVIVRPSYRQISARNLTKT